MVTSDKYSDSQVNIPLVKVELSDDEDADNAETSPTIEIGEQLEPSGSTSNKKKKKKKTKAKKILDALNPKNAVPQAVLEKVVERVKEDGAPGSENIDAEDVRQVLQQIKIMDVMKGKAGFAGNNQKDVGEHKVAFSQSGNKTAYFFSVLEYSTCDSTGCAQVLSAAIVRFLIRYDFPGDAPPEADGYIEPSKPREEVRQDPYPLPADFEWATINMNDPAQVTSIFFNFFPILRTEPVCRPRKYTISSPSTTWRMITRPSASNIAPNFLHGIFSYSLIS